MALLRELIKEEEIRAFSGSLDVPVARIVTDSRAVEPGDLFICLPGYRTEGGETRADRHDFIPVALERGAVAFIVERDIGPIEGRTVVRVDDCWASAADIACRYYGQPSRSLTVVGVTGTSGKTSTTFFVESILHASGQRVARIGTIDYRLGETVIPAAQTTPEAPLLQSLLRQAVDRACSAAVMEVSSHALELRRVRGVAFDVAVFTNLSQDHLNFHRDMHEYVRAKGRLFEELESGGKRAAAVVNIDDPASEYICRVNSGELVTYALYRAADVRARDVVTDLHGARFVAETPRGDLPIRVKQLGEFSVYNALAAVAVATTLGIPMDAIAEGAAATDVVPGRFELVDVGQDFAIVVDYAHKPDALERLLVSARNLGPKRIITVFGCGGDRDRSKRPVMGRIAVERSDFVFVTSDNPRSEDPRAIIDDILEGVRAIDPFARRHRVEVERAVAIREAVSIAESGDIVIIAGKGHETYQLMRGRRLEFDDRLEARAAVLDRVSLSPDPG
jgi:UDP-N-acetylmuramoyl-L-alanyl-D-glutamate--2,6-diaminopimelate ligase